MGFYLKNVFQFQCDRKFSSNLKSLVKNWNFQTPKKFYHVIEDITQNLSNNPIEQDLLLNFLISIVIYYQTNFFVKGFEIFFDQIYLQKVKHNNRFIRNNIQNLTDSEQIFFTVIFLKQNNNTNIKSKVPHV